MPVAGGYFVTTRVEVHDSAITAMNLPGGSVFKFVHQIVREAAVTSRAEAPWRTGELANSIEGKRPVTKGPNDVEGRVYAHAEYAKWVHEGTGPYIFPTSGKYLRIPPWGRWPGFYARSVRGQEANPFLRRGLRIAMVRNGLG